MDTAARQPYQFCMNVAPPRIRFLDRTTPPHVITLILMAGLGALSMNIFLPSLPAMAEHFGVDYAVMQLTVSLYLATTAGIQLLIGPISDRFGRRPVLLATIGIFTLASLGTLIAPTFELFLACRLIQAAIATTFALSRAVVRDMVPQEQAASMIGYVTMGMSVVPMIGPAIGGLLDQMFGWRSNFILLALCGVALWLLVLADQGETAQRRSGGFRAQIAGYPELLTSQRFWGYCLATAFASGAFFAYLGGAPFVGDHVFGMEPAQLGLFFGAPALGYMVGNGLTGRYAVRLGINRMVLIGALTTLAGMGILTLLTLAFPPSLYTFFGLMTFVGLGNGILLPNANAGMLSVRPDLAGSAAGLGGAFMIGGGAALSALAGVVLTETSGPLPLVLLMVGSSAASLLMVFWVIRRERALRVA